MFKKILLGLGVVVAVLVAVVATRPSEFRVERTLTISAPPAVPYGLVSDFRLWEHWSPYEKLDPDMKKTFAGAPSGVGAEYHWTGDAAGAGSMTITDAQPHDKVVITLAFTKPMAATNTTTFLFEPDGNGTKVTWRMEGQHGFLSKAVCLFMDMDKMVGADFEKGLLAMSDAAERVAAGHPVAVQVK